MSRFSGPQRQRAGRDERAVKRTEAEERNARTPAERRRKNREGGGARLLQEIFGVSEGSRP